MKDKLQKAIESVIALAVVVGCIILVMDIREDIGKTKPRCYIDNEILWTKDNQWQIWDVWVCEVHFSRVQDEARKDLKYPATQVDGALMQRIYEIIKERRGR
jgi:hypothetical protein